MEVVLKIMSYWLDLEMVFYNNIPNLTKNPRNKRN